MLIDTHCHLTDEVYGGGQGIVDTLAADGLEKVITVGYDLVSSEGGRTLAEKNANVYFSAGIHPSEADSFSPDSLDCLAKLTQSKKCVAVGEIGLDYHYPDFSADKQKAALYAQMELTEKSGLPVIFHIREADGEMLDLVRQNLSRLPGRGVVHCFSGSKETALAYVDMGFYVSFTGAITFKNAVKFPDILRALPRERVMIETDAPYLTPVPFRGKLNYPSYVRYVAEKLAEIWGVTAEEVASITANNAYQCFKRLAKG